MTDKPRLNLRKGDAAVRLKGTGIITARARWATETDYDLYALVLLNDGTTQTVSTFGAHSGLLGRIKYPPEKSILGGAVRHLGDVRREAKGDAEEVIEISMLPEIRAVIPVAYSAQSNGTGSFLRYKVSLYIDRGEDSVVISSDHANNNDGVYTCVIGAIEQPQRGIVLVRPIEYYSKPGSERRPVVKLISGEVYVEMDNGPTNDYK